jgi:phage/plasmid-like protein (TIGR03299 family)
MRASHQFGKLISEENKSSVTGAIEESGLNWTVSKQGLLLPNGQDSGAYGIVKANGDDHQCLGVVRGRYEPLQNIDAFKWVQPLLDGGGAEIITAGSYYGHRKVWMMLKLGGDNITVNGNDEIEKFLFVNTGHDGGASTQVMISPVRIACSNALSAVHRNCDMIRIRHTLGNAGAVENLIEVVDVFNKEFTLTEERYRFLANTPINSKDLQKFIKQVVAPDYKDDELPSRTQNRIDNVISLFESGRGVKEAGGDNYWKAYNAITEYLTHEKGNEESRHQSLFFGSSKSESESALEIATGMAKAA